MPGRRMATPAKTRKNPREGKDQGPVIKRR